MVVRGRITSLAALSVLGFAAAAGSAHAEPGLTVDPDSPAGVEYAVPLDSARGHGGHGGGGGAPGGGRAPATGGNSPALFGSGIKAAGGSGSGSGSGSRESDKGSGDGGSGGKSDSPAGG